jgi:hypothetical protein
MKAVPTTTLLTAALSALLLFSAGAQAKIVCWTNSDGVRECGNAVPPEYAQKKTTTLNEQGRRTETRAAAKTPEELAAERAREAEEKRLAEIEEKRLKEQQAYDRVLLATYLTENDIQRSRERQAASIDATIEITRITITKLEERLAEHKKKAAAQEKQGKALPERLEEDIQSVQGQIDDKNHFIASKEQEKKALFEKFDAELARFRELKNIESEKKEQASTQ